MFYPLVMPLNADPIGSATSPKAPNPPKSKSTTRKPQQKQKPATKSPGDGSSPVVQPTKEKPCFDRRGNKWCKKMKVKKVHISTLFGHGITLSFDVFCLLIPQTNHDKIKPVEPRSH